LLAGCDGFLALGVAVLGVNLGEGEALSAASEIVAAGGSTVACFWVAGIPVGPTTIRSGVGAVARTGFTAPERTNSKHSSQ